MSQFWLLKTEPSTYSFFQLLEDKKTNWNGVRNFQARNYLKNMKKGDQAIIYHSGDDKAAVGLASVIREAYPDPDPKKTGDWVQVDLAPVRKLGRPISLAEIKSTPTLDEMPLVRHSRLSVMPITKTQFEKLLRLSQS